MRKHLILALVVAAACSRQPKAPQIDISLGRQWADSAIALLDASDPIGVTATGTVVARLAGHGDSAYRLVDSAGRPAGVAATPAVGIWLAGDDSLLYTLAPGAKGVVSIKPDGSAGASYPLLQPGILRGVWGDSLDLVRPEMTGFTVSRMAVAGGGERVMVPAGAAEMTPLLDISPAGGGMRSQLASITTTKNRVVVANGLTYRMLVYSADGSLIGTAGRAVDSAPRPTARQVEAELARIRAADSSVTDKYLAMARQQLARQPQPFFSAAQGLRYDGAGRLWVVGYQADSAFADVFSDTTFVRRFPLACPGFNGQWDLKGSWLALGCGRRDPAAAGGELQLYRIREAAREKGG